MAIDLGQIQDEAARSWNLDPSYFRAIGSVESGNNVDSPDSPAGAQGPMQVMPGTASDMGVTDASDPVQNVYASAKYLSGLLDRYKDPNLAAAAYNAGPGRVDDYLAGKAPLPAETLAYVPKVAAAYGALTGGPPGADPFAGSGGTRYAEANTGTMTDASSGPATTPANGADPFSAMMAAASQASGKTPAGTTSSAGATTASPSPGGQDPFSSLMTAAQSRVASGAGDMSTPSDAPTPAPNTPQASWHQGTVLGRLVSGAGSLVSGTGAGFQRVLGGVASLADQADQAVPALRTLDASTGLDPAHAAAVLQGNAKAADAAHAGSIPYDVGNFIGETAAATPLVESGSGAIGLAGGALADALPVGGTLVKAGTNLLTGGAGSNALATGVSSATSGALKGAAAGVMANGNTSGLVQNALTGGALGVAAPAVAPVVNRLLPAASGAGSLVSRGINALAGDSRAPAIASDATGAPSGNLLALGTPSAAVPISPQSGATVAGDVSAPPPVGAAAPPPTSAQPGVAPGAPPLPAAAPDAAAAQPTPAPPRISVGAIPRVANADQLADQAIAHYLAGGPTEVVPSQIPGVQLTKAQATGNANVAALERTMRDQAPNVFNAVDQANNQARVAYLQGITGTPDQIDAAEAARDAVTSQARDAAFANKQPVDASPVVDQLQTLIDRNGARPTVSGPLQQVMNQLAPKDPETGIRTPLSDPEQLYNLRQYLGDMISPRATGTANDGQAAAAQLMQLKPTLDQTIESGAPGFQSYIGQFDQLSRPIDAMRFLQSKKLINDDGIVQRGKIGQLLHTVQQQQMAPGYRPADSLTSDQLQALGALHDDLNMAARSSTLGKSLGSNTAKNLFTTGTVGNMLMGKPGAVASYLAGGGTGFELGGGPAAAVAGAAVHGLRSAYLNRLAAAHSAATNALVNKLASVSP